MQVFYKKWRSLPALAVALTLAGGLLACGSSRLFTPVATPDPVAPVLAAYVGADTCQACHPEAYAGWRETLHPEAFNGFNDLYSFGLKTNDLFGLWIERFGDTPGNPVCYDKNEDTGISGTKDFSLSDGTKLTDVDGVYVKYEEGKFLARFLNESGTAVHTTDVMVFGHGKTNRQTYVVNVGDGSGNRLLKWHFRKDRANEKNPLGRWIDRNDDRIWQNNCVGCHATGYDIEKWEADSSLTAGEIIADIGVGCESCHGPGSDHIANPLVSNIVNPDDLTKTQQFDVCAQCHTRTTTHKDFDPEYRWGDALGFRPGDKVEDFVETIVPTWGKAWRRVSADGKGRGDHQMTFDLKLGPKADWSCTQCHSLHSVNGEGLMLKESLVDTCVTCHSDYDTPQKISAVMDGTRGWDGDDAGFAGKKNQHTFRLDAEGRVIGLPESEWPAENKWPWQVAETGVNKTDKMFAKSPKTTDDTKVIAKNLKENEGAAGSNK
ncbi:cytochrome c3 family protein [Pelovirga terrestris]|uniref:Cytochrome c-552/4 domain-containing protein n=1 Tax=Pelovirga terrestris TaxID=2771352 RepID=A0A8J6QMS6_9BACT|nr:multiheme c-type cytochrome [Pelovirga terrestris]MBD1399848.1 hypothetical protein [Pelovirga terrestris]